MPKRGELINLGATRHNNTKPRKHRSDTLPGDVETRTDAIVQNIESLVDVSFKPMFSEMYERGRGNITAFASDFLNLSLINEKTGQRHDAMERWWHTHPFATERHMSAANRWGKSKSTSVKHLHSCFYQVRSPEYASLTQEYITLNLSLTIDLSKIVWEEAFRLGLSSPLFSRFIVQDETKTAPFPTMIIGTTKSQRGVNAFRSEFHARSSAKKAFYILGRKFDYISYDECARDPHGNEILDEVLRMRMADRNGGIDMISTAAGKNWFWKAWLRGELDKKNGNVRYYSQSGEAYDNPFIDHARVRENEQVMAKAWIDQNIKGGFADYLNTFDRTQIEMMYDGVEHPICCNYLDLSSFRTDPDTKYLMAIDWARKRDETVILVADVGTRPARIVFAQGFSVKPSGGRYAWDELIGVAILVHQKFNQARCAFDSTGMGGDILASNLETAGMDSEFQIAYDFAGHEGKAKDDLILVTQQTLQNQIFKIPMNSVTMNLIDQLLIYSRDDKGLPTDWVFSFALLCENLRRANLPVSEILSLPLIFASGTRRFGTPASLFDFAPYELHDNSKQSVEMGEGIVIVSNKGYVKAEDMQA